MEADSGKAHPVHELAKEAKIGNEEIARAFNCRRLCEDRP
jgi:hypothetical protein